MMKNTNNNMSDWERKEMDMFNEFLDGQDQSVQKHWKKMNESRGAEKIDVNKAWTDLHSRLKDDKLLEKSTGKWVSASSLLRIAASVIIILGLSFVAVYFTSNNNTANNVITAGIDERNLTVDLPDDSKVFLNRNASITYPDNFSKNTREVKMEGEAFFDIKSNPEKPFIISAGEAKVRVLGTSFSINTNDNKVEVFVKTGKVLLTSADGSQSLSLEAGFVGIIDGDISSKDMINDANYLSWNTEILEYDGHSLNEVLGDLDKIHNIKIETTDSDILDYPITTTFNKQPPDTIIQIICTTFNLNYTKEGEIYYLKHK